MKKSILVLFLLANTLLWAQNPVNKRLGDFHEIRTYRGLDV